MQWRLSEYTLPEEGKEVLVVVEQDEGPDGKYRYVRTGVRLGNVFYEGVERNDSALIIVKYWMPLPSPPYNQTLELTEEGQGTADRPE
jgi:guanyl-specific ribonuclease Sa